ncbi:MAG: hypothetical protein IPH35_22535 [Rhodoferax sp.]|nr:hypothetical protein [Rhodoferax sp.]
MMTQLRSWWLITFLAFASPVVHGEIVVVVALDSPLQQMTIREVSDIYLGRLKAAAGEKLLVLDHPREGALRERFFKQVNGMDLRRLNAYWARLQFSGETQPPVSLDDSKSVLEMVRRNRHAIGYVDASAVDKSVRTVLTLKE